LSISEGDKQNKHNRDEHEEDDRLERWNWIGAWNSKNELNKIFNNIHLLEIFLQRVCTSTTMRCTNILFVSTQNNLPAKLHYFLNFQSFMS